MGRVVDLYMPLDSRSEPNAVVWAVAEEQARHLIAVIEGCGWQVNRLNADGPVASVAQGIEAVRGVRGERFINFMAGWAYPDFSVTPMALLPKETPKLMLGSAIPDFPGNVGLFAACSGTAHVGVECDRLFVEEFADETSYRDAIATFLDTGRYRTEYPATIDIPVTDANRERARAVKESLRGSIYGAIGPRSMQMWNKISEADFLHYFGVAREGFDALRLLKMAEAIPDSRAAAALAFLREHDLRIDIEDGNPREVLSEEMVLFQMKVYCALLDLKAQFHLDFIGVQDQLDWIEHYPATDLTLGLLNNRLRPESDGETIVAATEVDDGAAITMQILKLLAGGDPVGFNDIRYWDPRRGLYWFVNSGALAPYFAEGSHESFSGAWSQRQTPMYFKNGGGTASCVVRVPGTVTWARVSYRDHRPYLCAGRGVTDVPTEEEWRERSARCSPDWPHWYLKLCGRVEWKLNTNHPMTACGDHLADLAALAAELGIPFECYDYRTPAEIAAGAEL